MRQRQHTPIQIVFGNHHSNVIETKLHRQFMFYSKFIFCLSIKSNSLWMKRCVLHVEIHLIVLIVCGVRANGNV